MSKRGLIAIIATACLATGAFAAELSDVILRIEAATEGARSFGYVEFTQADGWWEGDTFYWMATENIEIRDSETGEIIGEFLSSATISSYTVPNERSRSNPQVNLGFAMQAGNMTTTFTVKSALLTFGPWTNPDARATASINVTDTDGGFATLLGNCPQGGAYLAQYNGFVPGGTTYYEAIDQINAGFFETVTADADSGWTTVYDTVGDMSTQISFTLTAYDVASGTSSFQFVPEPGALSLLLVGLGLLRRR